MVGIPGKSTGCITCRRRKIKCDAEKPACQRCLSTGRACEGYDKYAVFINNTQSGRMKRNRLEEARPAQALSNAVATPIGSHTVSRSAATIPRSSVEQEVARAEAPQNDDALALVPMEWSLPDPISTQAAATAGALGRFVQQYMPVSPGDRGGLQGHWLEVGAMIALPGTALETSITALAWSRAGWYLRDKNLTARSRILYGRALSQVHQALADPQMRQQDDVLVVCRALGLYELYESTTADTNGFHQHTKGLCRLVQMRGVASHYSPLAKAMLLDTKWSAMIFALTKRQSSFLSDEDWDAPFEGDDSLQPDLELARIGLTLGALLERLDDIQRRPDSSNKQASLEDAARSVAALHQRLRDWELHLASLHAEPIYSAIDTITSFPASIPPPTSSWPDSLILTFPNLRIAILLLRSWSIRPILLSTLISLCSSVAVSILAPYPSLYQAYSPIPPFEPTPSFHSSLRAQAIHIATLTTRSATYMTDPTRGFLAAQNYILPMRVATFVLVGFAAGEEATLRERDRCIRAYRDLSLGKGIGWARVMGKMSGDHRVGDGQVVVPEAPEYGPKWGSHGKGSGGEEERRY
ncbi:Transcriptional activator protein UGA3 [Sphaceloma murrayae]|uniref:Transcriptional activator protein UGA3 n=1 Tax=Sphaceloma murrayae TaxID=2082308 RepID=A0A2K1QMA5_9PEZI|nr:Transcriptional activator protein UGA3 [Sphaceloma murrayae]